MIAAIHQSATRRQITRLCHFTPSRNLVHIVTDPRGVLATCHLEESERAAFNPTDLERWDGHKSHVCSSIQYPNAWYLKKARRKDRIFKDWVVLLIAPRYLWMDGTKFCPRNASAGGGRSIADGHAAFESMFAERVVGAYGQEFTREAGRPDYLPTDEQAEVLIPDQVVREDILGLVVKDATQAKNEIARFELLQQPVPRVLIGNEFFDADALSRLLRSGKLPTEEEHYSGDQNV